MSTISKLNRGFFMMLLGLAALAFATFATSEAFAQGGSWETKASMPTARYAPSAGVVNGILYVIGGCSTSAQGCGDPTATVEAYNPVTDTWTTVASMPTARGFHASAVVNGLIYVVGGTGVGGSDVSTVEVYDPATNTWSTKAPMPTARTKLAAGVVNDILYTVGGCTGGGFCGSGLTTLEAYEPATDSWSTKAPMPTGRIHLSAGVVSGLLYAVGGAHENVALSAFEAYDPGTDTWSTKAPTPTVRVGTGVGVINGILYVAGGFGDNGVPSFTTLEAYDPGTDIWSTKAPMPTARALAAANVINGIFYVVGGAISGADNTPLATNEAFITRAFASFVAEATLALGPQGEDDAFDLQATFTLGTDSTGINPLTDIVHLQVGTLAITFPAGSFRRAPNGSFVFEGVIEGVTIQAALIPPKGKGRKSETFTFEATGEGANLTGTAVPVSVGLTIGGEGSSTTLTEVEVRARSSR